MCRKLREQAVNLEMVGGLISNGQGSKTGMLELSILPEMDCQGIPVMP
jgi:hypothetical protein